MLVIYHHEPGTPMTEEQIQRINDAANRPITFDEDCPELSPAQLEQMRQAVIERNRRMTPEQREAFALKISEYRKRQQDNSSPTIA